MEVYSYQCREGVNQYRLFGTLAPTGKSSVFSVWSFTKMFCNFYRPQRSWGKVIFSQASVILFTGGGSCLSACWDTTPPGSRQVEHTGRYGQRAGGMHPTGMQSCLIYLFTASFTSRTAKQKRITLSTSASPNITPMQGVRFLLFPPFSAIPPFVHFFR